MSASESKISTKFLSGNNISWVDYMDVYTCTFQSHRPLVVQDTLLAFSKSSTLFARIMMRLRNLLVKPFGLKPIRSNMKKNVEIQCGEKVGVFEIINIAENEIVDGEENKHLDYWVSFYLATVEGKNDTYQFSLSTNVLTHNLGGRLYFLPVKFFHKIIVSIMIRKMILQLKRDW